MAALISQIIITLHYDTADLLPTWYYSAAASSFSISLAVNALVTGFMIFKILTVYREFQGFNLKTNAGRSPQTDQPLHIISIFAESGLLTFVAQLVQIILYQRPAFPLVSGLIVMVYVRNHADYYLSSGLLIIFTLHREFRRQSSLYALKWASLHKDLMKHQGHSLAYTSQDSNRDRANMNFLAGTDPKDTYQTAQR